MKVPKYVMDIIVSRRNAAERFLLQDARLSKWLRHNGIEVSSGDIDGGADSLYDAFGAAQRVIDAIEEKMWSASEESGQGQQ